jgi:hypothetical protein
LRRAFAIAMDASLKAWKAAAERLWSAPAFDFREASQLAGELARQSRDAALQHAAAQALVEWI